MHHAPIIVRGVAPNGIGKARVHGIGDLTAGTARRESEGLAVLASAARKAERGGLAAARAYYENPRPRVLCSCGCGQIPEPKIRGPEEARLGLGCFCLGVLCSSLCLG